MDPDDSDDKNPAGARISRKEENAHTSADDATGETPVVYVKALLSHKVCGEEDLNHPVML